MTSTNESDRKIPPSDLSIHDPAQLFIPGPMVSDEDEFGTLISATVAGEYVTELGLSKVFIRILPVGCRAAAALREAVFKKLHDGYGQPHTYLRPSNIYLSEECVVCFGDVGIYNVLSEHLKSRRSLPGVKLWPHPRERDGSISPWHVDLWDLGITILELIDGGAALARMWRSGRQTPRLLNPSRRSAQLNSFLSLLFTAATEKNVPREELLLHRFVLGSSSSACRATLAEYMSSHEELIAGPYIQDTISNLFRQNTAVVRAPLINIDDISTDHFRYEHWNGVDQARPTVEKSLLRILRVCKEQPKPKDTEENKSLSRTIATIEMFLETADML